MQTQHSTGKVNASNVTAISLDQLKINLRRSAVQRDISSFILSVTKQLSVEQLMELLGVADKVRKLRKFHVSVRRKAS